MNDRLRAWLVEELKRRNWSHTKLAKEAGISQTAVSYVISGERKAGCDFLIKAAQALEVSPEYLLRLAEILPPEVTISEDATTQEITELLKHLNPEQRQEALNYIKYLHQQRLG